MQGRRAGKRKWQAFPGNNKFFCRGLLMSSRQVAILVFVVVTILVLAGLFFAFDARYLVLNIHPVGVGAIFPVIGALGLFYSLAFILKAGCIDPGIVPRALPDECEFNTSLADEDPAAKSKSYVGTPALYKTVTVNGQPMRLKLCVTCNVWRPPRASHCGLCNNCQEHFDHHCPWVGNCVAKRNYRYFYLFLCSVTVMSIFVMGCNVAVISLASTQGDNASFLNALKENPASVIEFAIAGIGLICVMGLAGMHTWLIAKMETTNEDIKGTFKQRSRGDTVINPYLKSRNCCENFCVVICGPFPPSLIDRRGYVKESELEEEGDQQCYGATGVSSPGPGSGHLVQEDKHELTSTAEAVPSETSGQAVAAVHGSQNEETTKLID